MCNTGFFLNEDFGLEYLTISSFEKTNLVKHMFTTRIGGYSSNEYESLNLGMSSDDDIENIISNYRKVANIMETSIDRFVLSHQMHNTNIKIVNYEDCGKGLIKDLDYYNIDGLITNELDVVLSTVYADCVPLFFLDPTKKVIGLAHAGWKGTVNKIGAKMVEEFIRSFSSKPEDILVGIGPSIGKCCYEVGIEVYDKFNKNFTNIENLFKPTIKGKWMLDLWESNKVILKESKVLDRNITISNVCTCCNDKFYSYRRDNGKTGRMSALIKLKK